MAFIDFAQPLAGAFTPARALSILLTASAAFGPAPAPAATFDPVEWQVIGIARNDRLSSLRTPGRWSRFLAIVFGPRPSPVLASDRLEALRRLAVEAWHRGYTVSPSIIAAARFAGFTADQLELLLATISTGRAARGKTIRP